MLHNQEFLSNRSKNNNISIHEIIEILGLKAEMNVGGILRGGYVLIGYFYYTDGIKLNSVLAEKAEII